MMPRRRFTKEQREAVLKARKKQARACARGNHWWYPDYDWLEKGRAISPQFWSVEERFPVPDWDGKSIVCHSCKTRGQLKNLTPKKQKKMQDIVDSFTESAISLRENYEGQDPSTRQKGSE